MISSIFRNIIGTLSKVSFNKKENDIRNSGVTIANNSGNNLSINTGNNYVFMPIQGKNQIDKKLKFKLFLISVVNELASNFKDRGNFENPFITIALKKLVYEEPMVYEDLILLEKSRHCLNIAEVLSFSRPYHPTLKPAYGQFLMRDLAEYISSKYDIDIQKQ